MNIGSLARLPWKIKDVVRGATTISRQAGIPWPRFCR